MMRCSTLDEQKVGFYKTCQIYIIKTRLLFVCVFVCVVFVCLCVCPDCIKEMGGNKPHLYLRHKRTSKCYNR